MRTLWAITAILAIPAISTSQEEETYQRAELQILDYNTNRTTKLNLIADHPQPWDNWTLKLRTCQPYNPKQAEDKPQPGIGGDVAWLEITQDATLEESPIKTTLFQGWLLSAAPNASFVTHPRYDVRLITCLDPTTLPKIIPQPIMQETPSEAPQPQTLDDIESIDLNPNSDFQEFPPLSN